MVVIYKIFDERDIVYDVWYGTKQDIINYLKKQYDNYNVDYSWNENLEKCGLSYEIVYTLVTQKEKTIKKLQDICDSNKLTIYEEESILNAIEFIGDKSDLNW